MRILRNLHIDEVSAVIKGANEGAQVMIRKSDDGPLMFDDVMLRGADANDDEPADKTLSAQLDEIVAAHTGLNPQRARRWLLHTPHGRELLLGQVRHTTKKEIPMPQVDIMKLVTVLEDGLMAMARLTKRDGETDAKAFSRYYENNIEFRKQWRDLTEVKHSLSKGTASLEPTFTGVGSSSVSDDSAEAVRLLQEMADKQHRKI